MPEEPLDSADLRPPVMVTVAAFVLMAAGLFTATAGLQLLSVVTVYELWARFIPWLLLLCGAVSMGVGGMLSTGRLWAALAAIPLALTMCLLGLVWTVWALLNGFFSPLPMLSGFLSLCALLFCPFAVVGANRLTRARAELFE